MQRYIYVHENEYGDGDAAAAATAQQQQRRRQQQQHRPAGGEEVTPVSHDAEWWSTEARALIHYVALWSAPDISSSTVVRVLCLLRGSGFASAGALAGARTAVVWIASFIQDHGDWAAADFRKCRLLSDCFEPNMQLQGAAGAAAGGARRQSARTLVQRAVAQNPPREAGESRRVFPLDQLDLRVLPESLDDEEENVDGGGGSGSLAAVPAASEVMAAPAPDAAAAGVAAAGLPPQGKALRGGLLLRRRASPGVTFARFESVFGSVEEAQEEWDLAEVVDGVGDLYRGDCGYALQLYAVEISGRGKFKGQKRPLIFAVILDAGCAQGSVLQALYPQMPRIARLIEGLIFRPAGAYEQCIVDSGDVGRRYQEALHVLWGEMRRQNELENDALVNDRYAEVSLINQVKAGHMRIIQNLQRAAETRAASLAGGGPVESTAAAPTTASSSEATDAAAAASSSSSLPEVDGGKSRLFVEEKLQGLMAQAENLLRRCTTHGATSAAVAASPGRMNRMAPGGGRGGAGGIQQPRLPGPPKKKPAADSATASTGPDAQDASATGSVGGKGSKPVSMAGFGSSIQALADDEPSFCSCVVS